MVRRTAVLAGLCLSAFAFGADVPRGPTDWLGLGVFGVIVGGLYVLVRVALSVVGSALALVDRFEGRGVSAATLKTLAAGVSVLVAGGLGPVLFDRFPEFVGDNHVPLAALVVRTLGAAVLALGVWEFVLDGAGRRSEPSHRRTSAIVLPFVRQVGRAAIWALAGVAMLGIFGVNVVPALAGLGIGGVAVALAAKDSIENVLGALNVVLDAPFSVGDWVRIDKVEGVVEEMNLRSTRIRTFDDSLVTVPNSNLIRANVENLGQRRTRRLKYLLPFEPPEDLNHIPDIVAALEARFREIPSVVADTVRVNLQDITGEGLIFQIIVHIQVETITQEDEVRQTLLLAALTEGQTRGMSVKLQR